MIMDATWLPRKTGRELPRKLRKKYEGEPSDALGLPCPICGHDQNIVVDSRPARLSIRRRRECLSCKTKYTTFETIAMESVIDFQI